MRSKNTIPVLVRALASSYAPSDIPWQDMDPNSLLALSMDGLAAVADAMTTGADIEYVVAEIGNAIACLGMLADTITRNNSVHPRVMKDVRELGDWILDNAPEEIGTEDDENVVQTALRLLKRQYEYRPH